MPPYKKRVLQCRENSILAVEKRIQSNENETENLKTDPEIIKYYFIYSFSSLYKLFILTFLYLLDMTMFCRVEMYKTDPVNDRILNMREIANDPPLAIENSVNYVILDIN